MQLPNFSLKDKYLGQRILSYIIDSAIIYGITYLVLTLIFVMLGSEELFGAKSSLTVEFAAILYFSISCVYGAVFLGFKNPATIGHRIINVRVINPYDVPLIFPQAMMRSFLKTIPLIAVFLIPSFLSLVFPLAYILMVIVSDKGLAPHDWLSTTQIIKNDKEFIESLKKKEEL